MTLGAGTREGETTLAGTTKGNFGRTEEPVFTNGSFSTC